MSLEQINKKNKMLNEKELLEDVKNNLIQNTVSLRHTFKNGVLSSDNEVIIFIPEGQTKRDFITCIPSTYENEKIDLRIRKKLAKQFVKIYSLELLQKEYIAHIKEIERKEKIETENIWFAPIGQYNGSN